MAELNETPSQEKSLDRKTNPLLSAAAQLLLNWALPVIDSAAEASRQPFRDTDMINPNLGSMRYGWTHYGIFFPSLPAPHHYCNVMTLVGLTGTTMFDNDVMATDNPRDTATFLSSTAAVRNHHYLPYSISADCEFKNDGSLVRFGENLVIRGKYPQYEVWVTYSHFKMECNISCTDKVSWFSHNFVYDHFSLLSKCKGRITYEGKITEFDTLCTFEYARCFSPHIFFQKPIPEEWKIPAKFFTYQIINIDATNQLLLTEVRAQGATAFKGLHFRSLAGAAEVQVNDVALCILSSDEIISPDGKAMRLPKRFSWTAARGEIGPLAIECTIDAPWRYGHGRGYVSSYIFKGNFRDQ